MWFLSPIHDERNLPSEPMSEWPVELMIDIFRVSTDVWYLEVADRCINPWITEKGEPMIRARDVRGNPVNHVPDSGWAALQIMCVYFEIVGFFASGGDEAKRARTRFKLGVENVFPSLVGLPRVIEAFWSHLRGRLYHAGPVPNAEAKKTGSVFLSIGFHYPALHALEHLDGVELLINPHELVKLLRNHLNEYCVRLTNPDQLDERQLFRTAFLAKYSA